MSWPNTNTPLLTEEQGCVYGIDIMHPPTDTAVFVSDAFCWLLDVPLSLKQVMYLQSNLQG